MALDRGYAKCVTCFDLLTQFSQSLTLGFCPLGEMRNLACAHPQISYFLFSTKSG